LYPTHSAIEFRGGDEALNGLRYRGKAFRIGGKGKMNAVEMIFPALQVKGGYVQSLGRARVTEGPFSESSYDMVGYEPFFHTSYRPYHVYHACISVELLHLILHHIPVSSEKMNRFSGNLQCVFC
jgi:hypothetical protein